MIFTYKSKGSADDWTNDTVEAESREEAMEKLDAIYGITRDESGKQTNEYMVRVVILDDQPSKSEESN